MTNSERIEAYFNNELPDAERQRLLNDIHSDSNLNSEFQFQQEVIEGIKDYRKKELIARLDQVKIASTGQSVLIKALSIVGVATVATIGTYMWMNNSADQEIIPEQKVITEQVETAPKQVEEHTNVIVEPEEKEEVKEVIPKQQADNAKPVEKTTTPTKKEPVASTPQVVVPSVEEPTDASSEIIAEEELEAPEALTSSEIKLSTNTNVEVKFSKKYNFHYQINKGRLTLFGDFGDTPFEVIELKTNRGLNSYLYFEENFYPLKTDSEKIRPLEILQDEKLISELKKRR